MRGRIQVFLLAALVALPALQAQTIDPPALGKIESRGLVTTTVGCGVVITLPSASERVAVADESIATTHIISDREVLLNGLAPGRTTVHVWLADGRRLRYLFQVRRDLSVIRAAVQDLDPGIEVEASRDGDAVLLRGEVAEERLALAAKERAEKLLADSGGPVRVLNLLRYPGSDATAEDRLRTALHDIDPRIRVRRIQVGEQGDPNADSYILEGRVRDVVALVQAVTLAERQLGGTGTAVKAPDDAPIRFRRFRGVFSSGGGQGQAGLQALQGIDTPPPSGLAAQLARGLTVMSESGRVISFLEVDHLPQIQVSIRVLEVDRAKARKVGFNFRFDDDHVSFGTFTSPGGVSLPGRLDAPTISDIAGNGATVFGAFVDRMQTITAAIDFLQEKNLARAVAEPNILTLSGEAATVLVGGEIPIPTTTANQVSTFQGFFFQDFGVRLDIRPTLARGNVIALEVAPSIVRPAPQLSVENVPGFQVQSVQTTARVREGQSLVIGGLLSFEESLEDRRLPGLGYIPLFRWKRRSRKEQELLFIITPRVVDVSPPEPVEELELPGLDWPDNRKHWRDEFEPGRVDEDGVPSAWRETGEEIILRPVEPSITYEEEPLRPTAIYDEEPPSPDGEEPINFETAPEEEAVTPVPEPASEAAPTVAVEPPEESAPEMAIEAATQPAAEAEAPAEAEPGTGAATAEAEAAAAATSAARAPEGASLDSSAAERRAIQLAQQNAPWLPEMMQQLGNSVTLVFGWKVEDRGNGVYLASYTFEQQGAGLMGWWWEVELESGVVRLVTGDPELEAKYGFDNR